MLIAVLFRTTCLTLTSIKTFCDSFATYRHVTIFCQIGILRFDGAIFKVKMTKLLMISYSTFTLSILCLAFTSESNRSLITIRTKVVFFNCFI